MNKRHVARLSPEWRAEMEAVLQRSLVAGWKVHRAQGGAGGWPSPTRRAQGPGTAHASQARRGGGAAGSAGLLQTPRGTLRLLAGALVKLDVVEEVSRKTMRQTRRNVLKPWRRVVWCLPPEGNAAFVAAMERVLEVYARSYDPRSPVVCMDEQPKRLVRESRETAPGRPDRPEPAFRGYGVSASLNCAPP